MLFTDVQRSVRLNKKKKSTNTSPYPDEVIDRLARAFYPAILACWNSEVGQREFAAWQAEQAHHAPSKEKQSVPDGERPVVHTAVVCGFNRKFYRQRNSQRPVCDMQFTVVANESNRELRGRVCPIQGAPCFCFIMVGGTSKRIYRFFFSLAASWLVLRCSTIWANHSTIAGSS